MWQINFFVQTRKENLIHKLQNIIWIIITQYVKIDTYIIKIGLECNISIRMNILISKR